MLPRRKTTTMSQGSSSVRPSKGTEPKHGPTGLPLIICPVCEEYEVIERISNTKANPRKRFFKCPRNEPNMPGKCTFIMWLERYQAHIVETGQLSMGNTYPKDAIPELFELSDKVREDVKSLKEEITELKEYIADMKIGRQNLGGGNSEVCVCSECGPSCAACDCAIIQVVVWSGICPSCAVRTKWCEFGYPFWV